MKEIIINLPLIVVCNDYHDFHLLCELLSMLSGRKVKYTEIESGTDNHGNFTQDDEQEDYIYLGYCAVIYSGKQIKTKKHYNKLKRYYIGDFF